MIYLDNASSMPPIQAVKDFLKKNVTKLFAPTNAYYFESVKSSAFLEEARIMTANYFYVSPATIRFTSGGTEANNIITRYALQEKCSAIITSRFEHPSVLESLKNISQISGKPLIYVPLDEDTGVNLKKFREIIRKNKGAFVSLAHVNRLTGRLLQISRIAELCHKNNAVFHCDMSLTAGRLDLDLSRVPVDFVSLSSHKCGGIRGAGVIYSRRGLHLQPLFYGENSEYGLRPGAENILAIYSMALALKDLKIKQKENLKYSSDLKEYLFKLLKKSKIQYFSVSEPTKHFFSDIININFAVADFQSFLYELDLSDIAVMPINKGILPYDSIRISFSPETPKIYAKKFVDILKSKTLH